MGHKNKVDDTEYHRQWRAKNREKLREQARARYVADPGKFKARTDTWTKKNRETVNTAQRRRYAEDPVVREKIQYRGRKGRGLPDPLRPNPGLCECCGKPEKDRSLSLDHCHTSGDFRGWLCRKCNTALGALGDNVALAIANLTRYAELISK